MRSCELLFLLLPSFVRSFVVSPWSNLDGRTAVLFAEDTNNNEGGEGDDGLVLNGLDEEMGQFSSKYSFTESDFLAAARKRAQERPASRNGATDQDWKQLSEEKKEQYGQIDDWDNSLKEAGNADSQILMFTDPPPGEEGEDGEEGEPKLLLL